MALAKSLSGYPGLRTQVLSALNPSDFKERHVYRSLPALAGRVTEAGLEKLVANPNVVRIDLDVGVFSICLLACQFDSLVDYLRYVSIFRPWLLRLRKAH